MDAVKSDQERSSRMVDEDEMEGVEKAKEETKEDKTEENLTKEQETKRMVESDDEKSMMDEDEMEGVEETNEGRKVETKKEKLTKTEMNKIEKELAKTVAPCNWNVDRIVKETKTKGGTKRVDVTAICYQVFEAHGVRRLDQLKRYKAALAHCIGAHPTKKMEVRQVPRHTIGKRTLECISLAPTTEYDNKILHASRFFNIKVHTLNTMLLEIEQELSKNRPPFVIVPTPEAGTSTGNESDSKEIGGRKKLAKTAPNDTETTGDVETRAEETPEASEPAPVVWTGPLDKNTPFTGDMMDETKSREERFRSFVHQIFYHVTCPHEREILEWVVKIMVDPKLYADVPNVCQRDKVLEYFKLLLPSIHASPFWPEAVRLSEFVKPRTITIKRTKSILDPDYFENEVEEEDEENEHELTKVWNIMQKRKEDEKKEKEERRAREEKEREDMMKARKEEKKKRRRPTESSRKPEAPTKSDGTPDRSMDERRSSSSERNEESSDGSDSQADVDLNATIRPVETGDIGANEGIDDLDSNGEHFNTTVVLDVLDQTERDSPDRYSSDLDTEIGSRADSNWDFPSESGTVDESMEEEGEEHELMKVWRRMEKREKEEERRARQEKEGDEKEEEEAVEKAPKPRRSSRRSVQTKPPSTAQPKKNMRKEEVAVRTAPADDGADEDATPITRKIPRGLSQVSTPSIPQKKNKEEEVVRAVVLPLRRDRVVSGTSPVTTPEASKKKEQKTDGVNDEKKKKEDIDEEAKAMPRRNKRQSAKLASDKISSQIVPKKTEKKKDDANDEGNKEGEKKEDEKVEEEEKQEEGEEDKGEDEKEEEGEEEQKPDDVNDEEQEAKAKAMPKKKSRLSAQAASLKISSQMASKKKDKKMDDVNVEEDVEGEKKEEEKVEEEEQHEEEEENGDKEKEGEEEQKPDDVNDEEEEAKKEEEQKEEEGEAVEKAPEPRRSSRRLEQTKPASPEEPKKKMRKEEVAVRTAPADDDEAAVPDEEEEAKAMPGRRSRKSAHAASLKISSQMASKKKEKKMDGVNDEEENNEDEKDNISVLTRSQRRLSQGDVSKSSTPVESKREIKEEAKKPEKRTLSKENANFDSSETASKRVKK